MTLWLVLANALCIEMMLLAKAVTRQYMAPQIFITLLSQSGYGMLR